MENLTSYLECVSAFRGFIFGSSEKIFFEIVAISAIFEYTISEPMACRSSRLEYDERVCLASASDGVLQSVEYRLRVGRACRKVGPSFFGRKTSHETCYDRQYPAAQVQR